MDRRENEG